MNVLQKITVAALLTGFALASNPARADVLGFSVAVPDLGVVTAEIGKMVAADMTAFLRSAISAPRVTRKHQSPSVTILEMDPATIETVTVAATRLPATIETVTVVATRLPKRATESLAQASTPTRL